MLQLEALRRSLESAKRRLSAQSRHMSQQWQRHITLSDTLRLLDDIQAVAQLPARLQKLEEGKVCAWPGGRGHGSFSEGRNEAGLLAG